MMLKSNEIKSVDLSVQVFFKHTKGTIQCNIISETLQHFKVGMLQRIFRLVLLFLFIVWYSLLFGKWGYLLPILTTSQ